MRLKTILAVLLVAGCATAVDSPGWRHSYDGCPLSGQAYFRGIPIASRDEHAQAERFAPVDPSGCLVYVVRSDSAGAKSAHAKVFLYRPESAPPPLPANYWPALGPNSLLDPQWSERHMRETPRELRKAEIFTPDVYAMWELAPGSYVLDASLAVSQPFARATVTCAAGRASFWAVESKGMTARAMLREIDETAGKTLVLGHLRSAGMQPGGPNAPGWVGSHQCPTTTP